MGSCFTWWFRRLCCKLISSSKLRWYHKAGGPGAQVALRGEKSLALRYSPKNGDLEPQNRDLEDEFGSMVIFKRVENWSCKTNASCFWQSTVLPFWNWYRLSFPSLIHRGKSDFASVYYQAPCSPLGCEGSRRWIPAKGWHPSHRDGMTQPFSLSPLASAQKSHRSLKTALKWNGFKETFMTFGFMFFFKGVYYELCRSKPKAACTHRFDRQVVPFNSATSCCCSGMMFAEHCGLCSEFCCLWTLHPASAIG